MFTLETVFGPSLAEYINRRLFRWVFRRDERRVLDHLRAHTKPRSGEQYMNIRDVARALNMDMKQLNEVVDRSPNIFRAERNDELVGPHAEVASVYEERGLLRL